MKRFFKILTGLADAIGDVCLAGMTVIILISVFWRYILNDALAWPEEVTRYLFITATYMGISIVMGQDAHLKMEVLSTFCGRKLNSFLRLVQLAACLAFFGWCVRLSFDMMFKLKMIDQSAVAFPFPLWIVWAGMLVAFIFTVLQTIRQLSLIFRPEAETKERQQ